MVETKPDTLNTSAEGDHDPHYDPIVTLPLKDVKSFEEDESELFKMHAKIFRWAQEAEPPEWKERGSGDVKLLQHKETKRVRLLMRRDKTLKICANHYIEEYMKLEPHCGSERAWLYKAHADFSDEEPKQELLVIRFYNAERAKEFKESFDKCIEINKNLSQSGGSEEKDEKATDTDKENTDKDKESAGTDKEGAETDKTTSDQGATEESKKNDELETATENLEALKIEKKETTENGEKSAETKENE